MMFLFLGFQPQRAPFFLGFMPPQNPKSAWSWALLLAIPKAPEHTRTSGQRSCPSGPGQATLLGGWRSEALHSRAPWKDWHGEDSLVTSSFPSMASSQVSLLSLLPPVLPPARSRAQRARRAQLPGAPG